MIARRIAMILLVLMLSGAIANAQNLAPLASGGAPPCPEHSGVREFHSSVARDGYVSAFIVGVARRDASGCRRTADIHIEQPPRTKSFVLPQADRQDFAIVDFSPDGSKLFLAAEAHQKFPDEQLRYLQITSMPIHTGEMRWQNAWDLLGWKDCDATVEPQGFTVDGKLAVHVRASVLSPPRRANCESEAHLYAIDEQSTTAARISDVISIKRYGKVVELPSQSCQSDPDLIGACFTVHGSVSTWNGAPTFRISRTGMNRVLGITGRQLPASVSNVLPQPLAEKINWDVEGSGDFMVCPFTVEQPGRMQMVCVESASHVIFKRR